MKVIFCTLAVLIFTIGAFAQNPYFPLKPKAKYVYKQENNPYSKATHVTTSYLGKGSEENPGQLFSFTLKEENGQSDTNRYAVTAKGITALDSRTYFADIFEYNTVTDTVGFDMVAYERKNTVTKLKEHTVLGKKYKDVILVESVWITLNGMIGAGEKGKVFSTQQRYFAKDVGLIEYRSGSSTLQLESRSK